MTAFPGGPLAGDRYAASGRSAEAGRPRSGPPAAGRSAGSSATSPLARRLGRVDYTVTWRRMRAFTDARGASTRDELWLCEHPSVYTLGQAGRREHVHRPGDIPLIETDRGGQVTWHGPGQVVVYVLLDLRRRGYGIRELVERLEGAVIDLLAAHDVAAVGRRDAPGVYVDGAKIAALGLRVRRGCTYHGLSFNVDADLAPFAGIDPCGYRGMAVTRALDHGVPGTCEVLGEALLGHLRTRLAVPATTA